jgi:ribosomal protein S18 acetylase RimI-like enzyme
LKLRPVEPGDVEALCVLVDADRLPGQPTCTPERVTATLAGRSMVEDPRWSQLVGHRTLVVHGADGRLTGAGSVGRAADGRRFLTWLHAREVRPVIDLLLSGLLRGVRRAAPVEAFAFATELSAGLEALPRSARPVTHEALTARGFDGDDRWLYLRATGAGDAPEAGATVTCSGDERGLHLEVRSDAGQTVGSAEVAVAAPGLGVVWWLEIEPRHQRQGYGRQLLRTARQALGQWGATETVLVVDHDDPSDRDRRPAVALYLSEGYEIVDHLWQYRRGVPVGG